MWNHHCFFTVDQTGERSDVWVSTKTKDKRDIKQAARRKWDKCYGGSISHISYNPGFKD